MLAKTLFPGVAVLSGAGGVGKLHEVPFEIARSFLGHFC